MEKRHRLSISFKQDYRHVYKFLVQKPNISDYICRVIEDDIRKVKGSRDEEIRRIVMDILSAQEISGISFKPSVLHDQLSNEDIELIDQLF
ncbi:hypothetical protein [Paenibacillus glycinis]|uniref:Uncharacterized protein n=1 Tax=Paenibacillus glycinis TaxID=2697035 RepID=A0ABW9XSW2_9BACL|nr:hypothetical protein [Paenibacillus glycinis]NBD25626.1 hypothetical protein [Paenibacillus glycinis]